VSLAWAYDLDWSPVPIFQTYSAYSLRLDEVNASALLRNPKLAIVREDVAIDGRFHPWDSPNYNVTLLCHFFPAVADHAWSVWIRSSDRCGASRLVRREVVASQERIGVPPVGKGQVLTMSFAPAAASAVEAVEAAVWKDPRTLRVSTDNSMHTIPIAISQGPLLLAGAGESGRGLGLGVPPKWVSFSLPGSVRFLVRPYDERISSSLP